jgi:hypothetical protein
MPGETIMGSFMKRYLVAVVAGAFALAGCEDGPNQTFNPSPAGAGNIWNNGNTVGNAGYASQGFTGGGATGTNRNEICDAQKKHGVWADMVKKPIHPPSVGGGLDIAGGPAGDGVPDPNNDLSKEAWTGLTLDQAEKINCQSTFQYDVYGDGQVYNAYWGDNAEVSVNYLVSTRQILTVVMDQGYVGTMEVDTSDKSHHFSIPVGSQISKDKAPLALDWTDPNKFHEAVNEMYGAVAATYSSFQPETDCFATGHCISNQLNDTYAYIWFTTVGFTMIMQNPKMSTALGATPIEIDQDKTKVLGFTDANVLLQNTVDKTSPAFGKGPQGIRKNVFGSGKDCTFGIGMKFSDFKGTCVAPLPDATKAQVEMTKLYSGIGHDAETFTFDVVGFDPNFQATSTAAGGWLDDMSVIQDADRPHDTDIAANMDVDQNTVGAFANDWANNDPVGSMAVPAVQDWHGIGLVTLEWAHLLQTYFNAQTGGTHDLGDPACIAALATGAAAAKTAGCSGLEGIVTTAPRDARGLANDFNALGSAPLTANNPNDPVPAPGTAFKPVEFKGIGPGLKPTTWQSFFCTDGKGLDGTGKLSGYQPQNCSNAGTGTDLSYFKNAFNQVNNIWKGDTRLTEMSDVRFFFKQWVFAFVRYLGVADKTAGVNVTLMDAVKVDQNNLFFDSIGAGQFEFAEYIDRNAVSQGIPPLDIRITADILHSIMNDFFFSRQLYRGETALYTAMAGGSTNALGQDNNVFLTNVFGSPLLKGLYVDPSTRTDPSTGKAFTQNAYFCATNITPPAADPATDPCGNARAPTSGGKPIYNDDGTLLLAPYEGAFEGTAFTVGQSSPITPLMVSPLIQAAYVEVPVYKSPYDPMSGLMTPVRKLIPWLPQGADVGFPVAINGSQDKWIETFQVDFSGVEVSANVDYQMVTKGQSKSLQVMAVETTDFLGETFLCSDPNADPQDEDAILRVRMYTAASAITGWFARHSDANTSCGMIYQYSEFGNYLDHVTSTTNGIRLDINPGGGQGRVVGVTFYDPNAANQ